jgi:hypothetical protein
VITRGGRILLRLKQGLQARFLRRGSPKINSHALKDFGIVGRPLVKFGGRQRMHTPNQQRLAGAFDWLSNPVGQNNLGLGLWGESDYTKGQQKGQTENTAEFSQRTVS